uniref:Uncharacterized protein n=1 Tax=Arundo donax TaxID=35708 RepID=A0A0A9CDP4_ARUDO
MPLFDSRTQPATSVLHGFPTPSCSSATQRQHLTLGWPLRGLGEPETELLDHSFKPRPSSLNGLLFSLTLPWVIFVCVTGSVASC